MVTSVKEWIAGADRTSPWPQAHVVVAGLGTSGFAAADALLELGARVTVIDDVDAEAMHDHARILETLGATLRLGPGSSQHLPSDADVVVTSPGWRPDESLLAARPRGTWPSGANPNWRGASCIPTA